MLKMVSTKSASVLGVVLAFCAFVLPASASASAANWTPVGTTGRIDSGNFGFSITALNVGWACAQTTFHVTVDSAAVATITASSFGNCPGDVGAAVGCTLTFVGTNFPWRATALDTTQIQIHGFDVDLTFETTPGTLSECAHTGLQLRWTGTVTASFTPGAHTFDFSGATGLAAHIPVFGVTVPGAVRGSATPTGMLNVIM